MALPKFTISELLEAGVHFGHRTHRWNPKMREYIFGSRNGIHIIDLTKTVPLLYQSLALVNRTVSNGGRVLFVGTKPQAQDIVAEAAERSGMYYVNHRWLGGTLTNWKTISNSIRRLKELETMFAAAEGETKEGEEPKVNLLEQRTKKERLMLQREFTKLQYNLGGIKDMGGLPDIMFVLDAKRETNAIAEARQLGIPVIGIVDTNVDPEAVDYIIPGNDDSTRSLKLYTRLVSDAILDGISAQVATAESRSVGTARGKGKRETVVKLSPKAAAAAEKEEESKDKDVAEKAGEAKAKAAKKSEKDTADKSAAVASSSSKTAESKSASVN